MKELRGESNCLLAAIIIIALQSCHTLKNSSKFGFNEGFYQSRIYHKKLKKVYVVPGEDSIKVYTQKALQKNTFDPQQSVKIAFPAAQKPEAFEDYIFRSHSYDVDLTTIIFKRRPWVGDIPSQFAGASLNWSLFFGYRTDWYHLKYSQTPLRIYKRNIVHYGFSMGVFSGIGATHINGQLTRDNVQIPYDAAINVSGIAAFIAIERFTYGITFGFDHLLDNNRKHWIYQGKPWAGLSVGMNIF